MLGGKIHRRMRGRWALRITRAATLAVLVFPLAIPTGAWAQTAPGVAVTLCAPGGRQALGVFDPTRSAADGTPEQFLFEAPKGAVGIELQASGPCPPLDIRLMRVNRPLGHALARARRGARCVGPSSRPEHASMGGTDHPLAPALVMRALLAAEGLWSSPTALAMGPSDWLVMAFDVQERPYAADLFVWARGRGVLSVAVEAPPERTVTIPGPRLHGEAEIVAIDLDPAIDSLWLGARLRLRTSDDVLIDRVELRTDERLPVGSAPITRSQPAPGPVALSAGQPKVLSFADPHPTPGVSMLLLSLERAPTQ